uniref:Uncharacterized protein n=1 Tax=Tanacetum cinerariifolium TaxID=118510 RepID=A0A6L2L2S5_TANCI|nr:hypothetical protein [Tanacetum cinerariifolium]
MVAYLERTDGNAEFHQIVDFLTASSIYYASTQIHVTVDGKTVVISESSMRNDLHFNDEDGISCLSNDEIFVNLALIGAPPSHEEHVTTIASQPQKTHTPRRTKRGQDTKIPQSSSPLKKVGDEVVYTREDNGVVKAATTTTSLETEVLALEQSKIAQDLVIKKLQKKVKRLKKKQRARTLRMNLFMIGGIDDNDDMVDEAMKNVEGDTVNTTTTRLSIASASITTDGVSISIAEPRTPPTTITTVFEDEYLTIVQTLVNMRNEELAKRMHEEEMFEFKKRQSEIAVAEKASRAAIKASINLELDDIQDMIEANEQMVSRLENKEQEQFTIEEKSKILVEMIAERKRFFAAQRATKKRSKPPTKAQMRNMMYTYLKNQAGYKHNQLKGRSYDDIQKLFDKTYKQQASRKKRAGLKLKPKSPKKIKVIKEQEFAEDEQEKEELRLCLKIVQDEDKAINYENLVVKSPIIDWETQLLGSDLQGEDLSYWKITRADGSFRFYKVFLTMLEEFDRHDLFDLQKPVMKRFKSVAPKGYDLILWGDLKTMIEPNEEDKVWRNQQEWSVIS